MQLFTTERGCVVLSHGKMKCFFWRKLLRIVPITSLFRHSAVLENDYEGRFFPAQPLGKLSSFYNHPQTSKFPYPPIVLHWLVLVRLPFLSDLESPISYQSGSTRWRNVAASYEFIIYLHTPFIPHLFPQQGCKAACSNLSSILPSRQPCEVGWAWSMWLAPRPGVL